MAEVTRILSEIDQGDPRAAARLLPLVYEELRKLATARLKLEKPGQTLQATALVHEAYLRLVDVKSVPSWNSRGHFFGAAAEAMRRILVERARRKGRLKRGGDREQESFDEMEISIPGATLDILDLDEALERLQASKPQIAELVKLRYFTGLTVEETAQVLGISRATADRHWTYARTWLYRELAMEI